MDTKKINLFNPGGGGRDGEIRCRRTRHAGSLTPKEIGFDARPHLLSSLPGRGNHHWRVLVLRMIVRPVQLRVFQSDGARFSLLSLAHRMGEGGRRPGEGLSLAGMREDVKPIIFQRSASCPNSQRVE